MVLGNIVDAMPAFADSDQRGLSRRIDMQGRAARLQRVSLGFLSRGADDGMATRTQ
jgi:hypothetical protein